MVRENIFWAEGSRPIILPGYPHTSKWGWATFKKQTIFFYFFLFSDLFQSGSFQPGLSEADRESCAFICTAYTNGTVGCYHNENFNHPYLLPLRKPESGSPY